MKKYVKYIIIVCIAFFIGCDDIIEDDITDDSIALQAPLDRTEIIGNSVQFRWNGIEGADEYRIQINNKRTNTIILDILVGTTLFDYTTNPGSYTWRVRGENFAYQTAYSFNSEFTMVASTNLEDQKVALDAPINNEYTNDPEITFSWNPISTATFYKIKISKVEGTTETVVFDNNDDNISDASFTIGSSVITEDSQYKWEILAGNDESVTAYSTPRNFFIDTQDPPAPVLEMPASGNTAAIDDEVTFTWGYTDTGEVTSGITSTIQIATDQDFNDVIDTGSNAATEYVYTFITADTYFWRVIGKDDAGNTGAYSEVSQIIIN